MNMSFEIVIGIPEAHRAAAALLYDQAFGQKLALAIPDASKRVALFEQHFQLNHALAAIENDKLLGLAGFSTSAGSLTRGIDYSGLQSELGVVGGTRAAFVLALYERKAEVGELLMDGISVSSDCRGLGVGTRLLSQLMEHAATSGYTTIRLDVIDTNPKAKRLYERVGFVSTKTEEFEFLRGILGFGASTTMIYDVQNPEANNEFSNQ